MSPMSAEPPSEYPIAEAWSLATRSARPPWIPGARRPVRDNVAPRACLITRGIDERRPDRRPAAGRQQLRRTNQPKNSHQHRCVSRTQALFRRLPMFFARALPSDSPSLPV
jgi:hypothetical protein